MTGRLLFGVSFLVVGMAAFMCWRHIAALWRFRHRWDVWFLLIYLGLGNTVGLVAEAVWHRPVIPLTWRTVSFGTGLLALFVGMVGVAYSVGRHDKRATDGEIDEDGQAG